MILTLPLEQITRSAADQVGGKAVALASLQRLGYKVPLSLAICTTAYRHYLRQTGLDSLILMELGRKDFKQMRWEEIWDAALRIRNLFLKTPLPAALEAKLAETLIAQFGEQPLVLRSSAPDEDSANASFAGLHNSFVNVCGTQQQLLAVRKVWASLWSDRALLYRQELGLAIDTSCMAVLVQELISGEKSGVAFSRSPNAPSNLAIEAVRGLNQGLVDGSIEPDYWALNRQSKKIHEFRAAKRINQLLPGPGGVQLVGLTAELQSQPVLTDSELSSVAQAALQLEKSSGQPQDIEWTWKDNQLVLLQARPITTGNQGKDDPRSWYLSLHRGLENLKQLKQRIENEILPGMEADAQAFAERDLQALTDEQLAAEIEQRRNILRHWEEAYRSDCIPMAHGIRLFGEFYNDALQPEDPFEFIELLRGSDFRAVTRNRELAELAALIRANNSRFADLADPTVALSKSLREQLQSVAESLGLQPDLTWKLLLEMARQPAAAAVDKNSQSETNYRQHFPEQEREQAEEILAIGRASYRLRDDDNLSLDKINRAVTRVEQEAQARLQKGDAKELRRVMAAGSEPGSGLASPAVAVGATGPGKIRVRQLQGQPASPGLATATARVIHQQADLAEFQAGEILVCDAIDPAMTFVVPLAAGIIERRGGMLIHGAIIAREYGIPCVSGIAAAAEIINTGDLITLDGYLGLVFFPTSKSRRSRPAAKPPLRKELDDALDP